MDKNTYNIPENIKKSGGKSILSMKSIENSNFNYGFCIELLFDDKSYTKFVISPEVTMNCQLMVIGGIENILPLLVEFMNSDTKAVGKFFLNCLIDQVVSTCGLGKRQFLIDYHVGYRPVLEKYFNITSEGGKYESTNSSRMQISIICISEDDVTSDLARESIGLDDSDDDYYDYDDN